MDNKDRVREVSAAWEAAMLVLGVPMLVGLMSTAEVVQALMPFVIGVKAALTDDEFAQFMSNYEEAKLIADLL